MKGFLEVSGKKYFKDQEMLAKKHAGRFKKNFKENTYN